MYQAPRVNSKYPPILDLKRPDARIRLFSNVLGQTFENGFPAAGGVILVKGVVGRPGRRQHLFPTPRKSTPSSIENHAANQRGY